MYISVLYIEITGYKVEYVYNPIYNNERDFEISTVD